MTCSGEDHAAQTLPAHTHPMLTGTVRQVFRLISLTCSFFSRKNIELLLFGVFVPSAGPWPLLVTQCHAEDRILGAEDLLDRLGRLFQHFDRGERLPSALQPALSLQPFHRSRVPCLTVLRLWQWCPLLSASQICGMSRRRLADASVLRIRLRSDLGLSSAEVTTPKPVSKKLFE